MPTTGSRKIVVRNESTRNSRFLAWGLTEIKTHRTLITETLKQISGKCVLVLPCNN